MSKVPIWAVTAPGARKPRFSREQIAATAMAIADAEGMEALSMRRVAEALGAGTMTLYHYVRTKEDLLALVEDALMGEIVEACGSLPKPWRPALRKLAMATRATCMRHAWATESRTGARLGPNGLRHVEQSLQAVASLGLPLGRKLEILSIVDDYVFGYCVSSMKRRELVQLDRKAAGALRETMQRHLEGDDFPQLRAMIGDDDPVEALLTSAGFMIDERRFEIGLDALLDGLARHFKLK